MNKFSNSELFLGNFNDLCIKTKEYRSLIVLFLTSENCIVCKRAKQVLPSLINENPDILFLEVMYNEKNRDIFSNYNVTNVPQFFFLKGIDINGVPKKLGQLIGFESKDIRLKITQFC